MHIKYSMTLLQRRGYARMHSVLAPDPTSHLIIFALRGNFWNGPPRVFALWANDTRPTLVRQSIALYSTVFVTDSASAITIMTWCSSQQTLLFGHTCSEYPCHSCSTESVTITHFEFGQQLLGIIVDIGRLPCTSTNANHESSPVRRHCEFSNVLGFWLGCGKRYPWTSVHQDCQISRRPNRQFGITGGIPNSGDGFHRSQIHWQDKHDILCGAGQNRNKFCVCRQKQHFICSL